MDESSAGLNLVEFNIIDNIIGSAVDELLLKDDTGVHQYDYGALASLLLPLCRFCASENVQMVHISDVHLQIINDLRIPEPHGTNVCTNICASCNGLLEEFCKFRSVCEEGQKRIATLLAERHGVPHFVDFKLDVTVARKDLLSEAVMNEPSTANIRTTEHGWMELVEDNTALERERTGYTESILILEPISSVLQPQISPQRVEARHLMEQELVFNASLPDALQHVAHTLEECNYIPQHTFEVTKPSTENKVVYPTNEAEVKDSKKPEARRRAVDGRLQWVFLDCEQMFDSCFQLKKHRRNFELVVLSTKETSTKL